MVSTGSRTWNCDNRTEAYSVTCDSTVLRMPERVERPKDTPVRASSQPMVPSWRDSISRVGAADGDRPHEVSTSDVM